MPRRSRRCTRRAERGTAALCLHPLPALVADVDNGAVRLSMKAELAPDFWETEAANDAARPSAAGTG